MALGLPNLFAIGGSRLLFSLYLTTPHDPLFLYDELECLLYSVLPSYLRINCDMWAIVYSTVRIFYYERLE